MLPDRSGVHVVDTSRALRTCLIRYWPGSRERTSTSGTRCIIGSYLSGTKGRATSSRLYSDAFSERATNPFSGTEFGEKPKCVDANTLFFPGVGLQALFYEVTIRCERGSRERLTTKTLDIYPERVCM